MKKIIYPLSILFVFITSHAFSHTLSWDIPLNERLEIVRTAKVKTFLNTKIGSVYEERNIIDLVCYKKEGKISYVKGAFTVYHRNEGDSVFVLREQFFSDFMIEPNGRFIIDAKYYMPNLRHVPTFPDKEIEAGAKWQAPAELVINNFSRPFKLLFNTDYALESVEKKNNRDIATVNYNFVIENILAGGNYPADFPAKILGQNQGTITWDLSKKCPVGIKEVYRMFFLFASGVNVGSVEYWMNIETENMLYGQMEEKQIETERKELEKQIPKESGIDVDTDKRGLVIRMGDILFDFDSFAIRKDTREKLDKVIEILKKKYPDREIIVEGHTDNTGEKNYNQKLSENRARSIAEFMKPRMGHDKFSYRGYAADKPISDNATKEGRQQNRRVEIIIKLR